MVTHDPNVAAVADERLVLQDGRPVTEDDARHGGPPMKFVLMMAAREMRASWHRLLFFFVCIAIGVGAIVALRSVIQSVRNTFAGEARSLIAADAIVASNQPLKPEVIAGIDKRLAAVGAESIRSVELATMARPADRADGRARMVELRAVERGFPYYGQMKLADGAAYSHGLLENFGVLVRPELLAQLDVKVGDGLTIGSQRFTIRGVLQSEPGRRLGAFSIGPRVFVDLADLEKTGLMGFGSRAAMQRLLKVPDAAFDKLVVDLRADLANQFARVRSYKATEDDIGEDFTRAENYLSLVGLVIVILGGIGVSSVTRVFVQQKMKSIAVLKCLGARSAQLLAVYVAQVAILGLAGSLLGVLMAALAMRAIPSLLAGATPGVEISYALTWPAILQGIGIGLLVSLLFSLVPLLDVRHVKPSLLLRDESHARRPDVTQIVVTLVVVAGLVGLTVWQAGSLRIGSLVAGGFAATAIVLHLAGTLLLRAIKPLARSRSFALRHAVLQLSRPGSQMRIVLLAVGLGSFFIIGVRSLQENLDRPVLRPHGGGFARHVPAGHPGRPGEGGRVDDCFLPGSGRRCRAARAGLARPRRWRRRTRDQPRGLRGRPGPWLAGPRIHHHLPVDARVQRAHRGRQIVGSDAVRRTGSVHRAVHQRELQDQYRRHRPFRRAGPDRSRQRSRACASWSGPRAGPADSCSCSGPAFSRRRRMATSAFLRGPQDLEERARLQAALVGVGAQRLRD